jgi:HD-GYP domain-containing protein (c-di-GMP phosphodiesterase class II)
VAEIAANAIHRSDLFDQTRRHLERLTALHDVDIAISTNFDINSILNFLLEQVVEQFDLGAADILLLNTHTHYLEYAAGVGFRSGTSMSKVRLRLTENLAGRTVLERRIVKVDPLEQRKLDSSRSTLLGNEHFVAYHGVPLLVKGQVKGVLELFHRVSVEIDLEGMSFLESLANQAAIAIDNAQLFDNLQRSNLELSVAYDATIEGWAHALELRDLETEGHSERVVEMTVELSSLLGFSDEDLVNIRRGALLHDIGKMGVPDNILRKPGLLNETEWEVMRRHPGLAHKLLSPIVFLQPAVDIPYCHHESWDGNGYPRGLKGDQIPLTARIFSVVDVYDATTSDRPYHKAWSVDEALNYLREESGKKFDPRVVTEFLRMIAK